VDLLIGGLGVGFSLDEATRSRRPASITVVEIEPAVIGWHRDHLDAGALADPRVRVVRADLLPSSIPGPLCTTSSAWTSTTVPSGR
jgi:spermidine synthase